jgi:thiamine pyridinylase
MPAKLLCKVIAGFCALVSLACIAQPGFAATLTIRNTDRYPVACVSESWPASASAVGGRIVVIPAAAEGKVSTGAADAAPLGAVRCGAVEFPNLNLGADSADRLLVLTGAQTRSLNVSIYPYLPTDPAAGFGTLVQHVVETYQSQNPGVALNAVMDLNINIYSFDALPLLLTSGGYDVVEADMLYLGALVEGEVINPAGPAQQVALPVAVAASTYRGTLWAVPSWLCMDFIFTNDTNLASVQTLQALIAAMPPAPSWTGMALVGDFNGSWRLPSIYINAFVQQYGYGRIADAFTMPADPAVIANLASLTTQCATATSAGNPCTDGTIHTADGNNAGASERIFASGSAAVDVGFSERSFFIGSSSGSLPSTIIPVPWGPQGQALLFADSFVTSRSNCPPASACTADAAAFIDMMTGIAMRNYIVMSQDLGSGFPWRTLLVANQDFYAQPMISANPVYQRVSAVFASAQPFPNSFTADIKSSMGQGVCQALKQVVTYTC